MSYKVRIARYKVGMHNIGFSPISDEKYISPIYISQIYADIFQLILPDTNADTDIFPFVWKKHQVSPVQKL